MKQKALAFVALMLCILLVGSACTPSATSPTASAPTDTPASASAAPQTGETVTDGPRELSILIAEPTTLEDVTTNYATKYLEEKMDVKLTFNYLPSTEWATKFEVMVTAGDSLSDILFGTMADLPVGKYGASGVFIDQTPYYEEYSQYIKPVLEANPQYKNLITFADGKMYAAARLQEETHTEYPLKLFINQQWLDNLGLQTPTTLDDFTQVLKAFRDNDPNGNGQKDEIPISGATTVGSSYDPVQFLMGSFTFVNLMHYLNLAEGQLVPVYTTEEWREGLRYMKMLHDEGLLDSMCFTQDLSQYKALIQKEGDTTVGGMVALNTTVFDRSEKMLEYTGLAPLAGPNGTQYAPHRAVALSYNGFITRDCKDPVLAFQFLDYCWESEASMVIRYGEESVDWEWVAEGTKGQMESSGYPATYRLLSGAQSGVQNKWWNVWSPMYLTYDICNGRADDDDPLNGTRIALDTVGLLQGKVPENVVGKIVYSAQESQDISEINSNLTSYWQEARTLFILGDMDLDKDWDAYLAELDRIGLPKYLEVSQAAYERTYAQ